MPIRSSVAIIGAGGIGSYFCQFLDRDIKHRQFGELRHENVTIYDFDIVEKKNLRHQHYYDHELDAPKAGVMASRYGYRACMQKFDKKHLGKHNTFIICADNPGVRAIVYEHCKDADKVFLDMRTEGDLIAMFTSKEDKEILMNSLGENKESEEGRSCQIAEDVANNITQHGNKAVAAHGAQTLLETHRGEGPPFKSYISKVNEKATIKV